MNSNYKTQGVSEAAAREQARIIIKRMNGVDKGSITMDDALAEFYMKTQYHTITTGDFALVVNDLYKQLSRVPEPQPGVDKKERRAYDVMLAECKQVVLSAKSAYAALDHDAAFKLHNNVVNRVMSAHTLTDLARTFGTFREERYQNTGRPSGAHDVRRAKTSRSWVTAPSGD